MKEKVLLIILILIAEKVVAQLDKDDLLPIIVYKVKMKANTVFLSKDGQRLMDSVVKDANFDSAYEIIIESFIGDTRHIEREYQLSWDKAYSVFQYLTAAQFDTARIQFLYGQEGGDSRTVSISLWPKGHVYTNPRLPLAPFSCYSYHKLNPKRCKEVH